MRLRRPEIFISCTSGDLGRARRRVRDAVDAIGCHAIVMETLPADYQSVHEKLRHAISNCDAVIHIAGKLYGCEPMEGLPENVHRRSYTQIEVEISRRLGRPLYVFVCAEDYPYDDGESENEERQELQARHREALLAVDTDHPRIATEVALVEQVHRLEVGLKPLLDELTANRWILRGGFLAVLAAVGGVWWRINMMQREHERRFDLAAAQHRQESDEVQRKGEDRARAASEQSAKETLELKNQITQEKERSREQLEKLGASMERKFESVLSELGTLQRTEAATVNPFSRLLVDTVLEETGANRRFSGPPRTVPDPAVHQKMQADAVLKRAAAKAGMKPEEFREKLSEAAGRVHAMVGKMEALDLQMPPNHSEWSDLKRRILTKAGDAFFAAGRFTEAAESYDKALKLSDPDKDWSTWSTLMEMLALSQHGMGDNDKAVESLKRLLAGWVAKEGPHGANVLRVSVNLGNLYYHMSKLTEAMERYEAVRTVRAETHSQESAARTADDPFVLEAKARLDEITGILESAKPKPPTAPRGLRIRQP